MWLCISCCFRASELSFKALGLRFAGERRDADEALAAGELIAVSPGALQGRFSPTTRVTADDLHKPDADGVEQEPASTEFLLVHPRSM